MGRCETHGGTKSNHWFMYSNKHINQGKNYKFNHSPSEKLQVPYVSFFILIFEFSHYLCFFSFFPFQGIASFFTRLSRDPFQGLFPLYHVLSHTHLIQAFFFSFIVGLLPTLCDPSTSFARVFLWNHGSFGFHKAHDLIP